MVLPVEADARGIVAPRAGLTRFELRRYAPSGAAARFVDRYWVVTWDLTGQEPHVQPVLAHPVVNVVFADDQLLVHGVATRLGTRTLAGAGRAFGIMFRPAGFRPFLGQALSSLTDRSVPATDVFGPDADQLAGALAGTDHEAELVHRADAFVAGAAPAEPQASEQTTLIVERVAADPAFVRVAALARELRISERQLQRRFADHVGASPKAVIRRYRFYEAAERGRQGGDVDWAHLATELGYSDQSHLTRDFTAAIGSPPGRYARACRG